ncbi:unnamed protein product [Protopolystoma xenopodis]|uniref:Uncharacterized protein n=1 Tax=Protopolystoma xenopodis TaxID=117903 RepID=A0A3S5A798_9PLAT|nr:unnamed protein product [Protopolystoma xenopodis]
MAKLTDDADYDAGETFKNACRFGRVQHLEHLISYGADINSQTTKNGNTPLHICSYAGQEACTRLLLFRGANRRLVNRAGHTAYQQAVLSQHHDLANVIQEFKEEDIGELSFKVYPGPICNCPPPNYTSFDS